MSFLTDLAGHIKTWVEANFSASTHNHNLNDLAEKSYNSLTDKPALGEANTASNLGTGEGVFANKDNLDLELKSLVAGDGVQLSSDANEITISSKKSISTISTLLLSNQSVWGTLDFTSQSAYRIVTDDLALIGEFIDFTTIQVGEKVTIECDNADYVSQSPTLVLIAEPSSSGTSGQSFIMPKGSKRIITITRTTTDEYSITLSNLSYPTEIGSYGEGGKDFAIVFAPQNLEAGIPINSQGFPATGDNDVVSVTVESANINEFVTTSINGITKLKIGQDVSAGQTLNVWFGKAYQSGGLTGLFTALEDGTTDETIYVRWT